MEMKIMVGAMYNLILAWRKCFLSRATKHQRPVSKFLPKNL